MIETKNNENNKLNDLLNKDIVLPKVGDNVEGTVIRDERNTLYVDLGKLGTGIIFGKEYLIIKDIIRKIPVGGKITAKIIELEGENGYIELSLKEAKEAEIWVEAQKAMKEKRVLRVRIAEANKGGLMINWQGLVGFLPASQLGPEHYPKVAGGDANRVAMELQKLVGKMLDVVIITAVPEEEKLVFSEKEALKVQGGDVKTKTEKVSKNLLSKYSVGDILDVEISGIVDFGLFCKLEDGNEALIHISEVSWSLINDLSSSFKIGDKVKAKVIEVNDEKVSLSIKALIENPWKTAGEKYKNGDKVKGVVIKISEHGALVSIEEGIYGLIHVSNFKDLDELKEKLKLGGVYDFEISQIDTDAEKMTLVLV